MDETQRSWSMTRLGLLAFSAAFLAACGGLPPATHPLFIARPDSASLDSGSPRITVEMNNVVLVLPGSTTTGCSMAGNYVRKGSSVEVELRQGSGTVPCNGAQGPFITLIGPFPPGEYEVTVMLDGKPLIRAERAVIS
jgi:hypothetical protein